MNIFLQRIKGYRALRHFDRAVQITDLGAQCCKRFQAGKRHFPEAPPLKEQGLIALVVVQIQFFQKIAAIEFDRLLQIIFCAATDPALELHGIHFDHSRIKSDRCPFGDDRRWLIVTQSLAQAPEGLPQACERLRLSPVRPEDFRQPFPVMDLPRGHGQFCQQENSLSATQLIAVASGRLRL